MISRFFIERPRFAMVIALLFLLAGSIAIQMLPVTQYPNIAPSLIQVTATYPGADASTVRDTVNGADFDENSLNELARAVKKAVRKLFYRDRQFPIIIPIIVED